MLRKSNFAQLKLAAVSEGAAGDWGDFVDYTISSGIATILTDSRNARLTSESGTTDDLDQILGLNVGQVVIISAVAGHTITVKDGSNILTIGVDFSLSNVNRSMSLQCISTGIVRELMRTAI